MPTKPFATIVEELNNVLTVVAMCTDELESLAGTPLHASAAPTADLRAAVRRGAELTRALAEHRPQSVPPPRERTSDVHPTAATILVVDEDPTTRHALTAGMEGRGWRIIAVASVDEAFQDLESVRSVDVAVIDTTMAGRRFASQLVERYPSATVIYIGGYTDDRPLREELPTTEVSLLCRPFEKTTLVARVGEALTRRR